MAQKVSDLEQDEKHKIQEELEGRSSSMGMDSWESYGSGAQTGLKELIGMCYNCKYLLYCKTEYGNVLAKCSELEMRLSGQNRITECNLHAPKYAMSLNEMYSIAWLIDADTNKKVQGFIGDNNK